MKKYYLSALLFSIAACGSRNEATHEENIASKAKMERVSQVYKDTEAKPGPGNVMSSSAAQPGMADSVHRFIRTANLKFRTSNVIRSSFSIEDIVAANGGYIQHSRIQSDVKEEKQVRCSKDSAWRITRFVTYNQLKARVPVERLDQALKSLHPLAAYLDYRTVDARNIAFDLYLNQLKQQSIAAHSAKAAQFSLKDQALTADQLLERQMESDRAKVENMRTMDEVLYSTIDIYMYQHEEVEMEKIPVPINLKSYDSGFGNQLLESIGIGWELLEFIFLLVIKCWSLLLILVVTLLTIRWWRRKRV